MQVSIRTDDPTRPECLALLQAHHAHMLAHTDPDKIYALDAGGLAAPGMTFWTMWNGAELIGFGALKMLDAEHGEIKSMHTVAALRGQGLAGKMLDHITGVARARGDRRGRPGNGAAGGWGAVEDQEGGEPGGQRGTGGTTAPCSRRCHGPEGRSTSPRATLAASI